MTERLQDNLEKIKLNKQLPYLVANVVELLEVDPEGQEEGANVDLDSERKGKCAVVKTSTRTVRVFLFNCSKTVFLPLIGLVESSILKPGDLVGVNKDSFLILDTLPSEYDSRVKAMELDEKPSEDYSDIGGLDKQIEELVEAVVLPMTHPEKFTKIGIKPPKGMSTQLNYKVYLCMDHPGLARHYSLEHVRLKQKPPFLNLQRPNLCRYIHTCLFTIP